MTPGMAPSIALPDWAQVSDGRRAHIARVAALVCRWAERMTVTERERNRWLRAVALHDALKDAPSTMLEHLAPHSWDVIALRHGPAAAERAAQDGESDVGVLDAVRFHSVGYAGWDHVGKVLYLADYLEPGRDYRGSDHGTLIERVPSDLSGVLRTVAAERIAGLLARSKPLLPETVGFWNSLVG